MTVPTAGDGFDATSGRALDALRDDIVPGHPRGVGGVQTSVTGAAAEMRDFNASMVAHLPYVFGFVFIAAFALLLVTFRSIVIPIKAIVLNLLSVAAAYGVLVSVFQNEWAEGLLGFNSTGAIVPVAAAVPVRDPVRPLDGLPRVHPHPHPRGLRPRDEHLRRRRRRASAARRASSRARRW